MRACVHQFDILHSDLTLRFSTRTHNFFGFTQFDAKTFSVRRSCYARAQTGRRNATILSSHVHMRRVRLCRVVFSSRSESEREKNDKKWGNRRSVRRHFASYSLVHYRNDIFSQMFTRAQKRKFVDDATTTTRTGDRKARRLHRRERARKTAGDEARK